MMMALRNAFIIELPPLSLSLSSSTHVPPARTAAMEPKKVWGRKKTRKSRNNRHNYLYTRSGEQRTTSNVGSLDALIGRPLPLRLHALFIIPWLFQVRRPIVSSGDAIFFFVFLFFFLFSFPPFLPSFPDGTTLHEKKKPYTHTHTS
jgi:hypothetical protein